MSRQPSRSVSASHVVPPDIDADELHRIAVARRQARTGQRGTANLEAPQAQIPTRPCHRPSPPPSPWPA